MDVKARKEEVKRQLEDAKKANAPMEGRRTAAEQRVKQIDNQMKEKVSLPCLYVSAPLVLRVLLCWIQFSIKKCLLGLCLNLVSEP